MRALRRPLTVLLRLGLAAILLFAAASKWQNPHTFAEDVANYRLLPAALVPVGAAALLGVETVLGLLLLCGVLPLETALATALLLLLFSFAVASALLRHLKIECGCFGAGDSPATVMTFLRDLGFLLCAGLLVALRWRDQVPPPESGASPPSQESCQTR